MHYNMERSIDEVLEHEGGFVNNAKDPGGATNKGITLVNFRRYVDPKGTVDELKKITTEQARTVYEQQFWNAVRGDQLPAGLDHAVNDFGVNSGPATAIKKLQEIVQTDVDGRIGPETLKAIDAYIEEHGVAALIDALCDSRLAFMRRIRHRTTKALLWDTFGKGWAARVLRVRKTAKMLAIDAPVEQPKPIPAEPVGGEPATPKRHIAWGRIIGVLLGIGALVYVIVKVL
jgi:lysozyme family protein